MADHYGCCHYTRLCFSFVGVVVGFLASVTFALPTPFQHISASALAFVSAVFAAVCLMLHGLHHRGRLQVYHSTATLDGLMKLGFCMFTIGFALTGWFIFDGVYHHIGMKPFQDNPYISAVWSFMSLKWGFMLFYHSRMYSNLFSSGAILVERENYR